MAPRTASRPAAIALYSGVARLAPGLAAELAAGFELEAVADPATARCAAAVLVGVVAQHDLERFDQLQACARRSGATLVCVAVDAHVAWIGPTAAGAEPGCLRCLELWTRTRWSRYDQGGADHPASADWSWSGGHADILAAQLRQVAEAVAGGVSGAGQQMVRFDVRSMECSRHALSAHPDCPHCAPRRDDAPAAAHIRWRPCPRPQPRSYRMDNPALDADALKRRYVDKRVGFVRNMYDDKSSPLMPQVLSAFMADKVVGQYEVGCGRTGERASSELVSILEAFERFCGFEPRAKRTLRHGTYAALAPQAADPRAFILHEAAQRAEPGYQLAPYDDTLALDWVWAHSARHDQARLVPEQLGYYRLPARAASPRFVYEISNGCALGNGIEEAVLHGLFEVIERDAFLTTWYGRITPVELDIGDALDPTIHALALQAGAAGWQLRVFDMSLGFGVPSIMVMLVDDDAGPVKSLCLSGAHLDPEKAILGALVEALASFSTFQRALAGQRERAAALLADPGLVQTMADHQLLYSHPDSFARLDFLTGPQTPVPLRRRFARWYRQPPPADLTDELRALIARLLTVADDVLVVDQTSDELARLGLRCVKVLAPGLLPMTFGHQHRRVSAARVNHAHRMLGSATRIDAAGLNPHPHNFP